VRAEGKADGIWKTRAEEQKEHLDVVQEGELLSGDLIEHLHLRVVVVKVESQAKERSLSLSDYKYYITKIIKIDNKHSNKMIYVGEERFGLVESEVEASFVADAFGHLRHELQVAPEFTRFVIVNKFTIK